MLQLKQLLWQDLNLSEVGIRFDKMMSNPQGIELADLIVSAYDLELGNLHYLLALKGIPAWEPLAAFRRLRDKLQASKLRLVGMREILTAGIRIGEPVNISILKGVAGFTHLVQQLPAPINATYPTMPMSRDGLYESPFLLAMVANLHEQLFYAHAAQSSDDDWEPGEVINALKEAIMWRNAMFGSRVMPFLDPRIEKLMSEPMPIGLGWIDQEQRTLFVKHVVDLV